MKATMVKKIEIHDMALELNNIANSGIITQHTAMACTNAADVLIQLRSIVLGQSDDVSDKDRISQLRDLLSQLGEG